MIMTGCAEHTGQRPTYSWALGPLLTSCSRPRGKNAHWNWGMKVLNFTFLNKIFYQSDNIFFHLFPNYFERVIINFVDRNCSRITTLMLKMVFGTTVLNPLSARIGSCQWHLDILESRVAFTSENPSLQSVSMLLKEIKYRNWTIHRRWVRYSIYVLHIRAK